MRVLLAQLDPAPGDVPRNLATLERTVRERSAGLYVFPELFLSGYRVGDAFHRLALPEGGEALGRLGALARERAATIVVGAPVRHARAGELRNASIVAGPDGSVSVQGKRFLPTYGPFEEGTIFTPEHASAPVALPGMRVGTEICYDAFFPEVSRELALAGADLLVIPSAAPVTSRALFDRVLPARAVENALPVLYVNRVGVEDGIVFGGGSVALDARGSPIAAPDPGARGAEALLEADLDLAEAGRWRPFRPVLRDVARAGPPPKNPAG